MIIDWKLPTSSQDLYYFIGLIYFYHNYASYFEMRIKPLRKLYRNYFRKIIPSMEWSPDLIKTFEDMKECIKSLTILACFDPTKQIFLKIDWSA